MDKCLAIYCANADNLNNEQVKRAIRLAEIEGDTRCGIMRLHIRCCGRARNILRNIYQEGHVYKKDHTWIWEPEMCFD